MDDIISEFYMGHLPMITKFNANIGCVMSLKWSHVHQNVAEFDYMHDSHLLIILHELHVSYLMGRCIAKSVRLRHAYFPMSCYYNNRMLH